ncbi:Protein of unknown function [Bacillus wiedmannii]|nr:Protein of unknown function [Bacillus wiedmannii]
MEVYLLSMIGVTGLEHRGTRHHTE